MALKVWNTADYLMFNPRDSDTKWIQSEYKELVFSMRSPEKQNQDFLWLPEHGDVIKYTTG